jgi:hypothetical protein
MTYAKENEINEVEAIKDFDIKMILELKKIKFNLENEGYIPSIDEAIARIASKWAKDEVEEDNDDCREIDEDLETSDDSYPEGFGDNGY